MINIFLDRKHLKPEYAIGIMTIKEAFFACDTLEDKVRDLNKDGDLNDPGEGKVYGKTAIPYGRYRVKICYSPKFKRKIPFILNVPHFEYIRIHALNWPSETDGCVGVGENKVKGGLINSRKWEDWLTLILLRYQQKGEEIYINII